jgi:uncharacterized membrane protein YsdA (DUF1294 family)
MTIIQIAAAVFVGNVCTLIVYWCWKEFQNPNEAQIPMKALLSFILIVGLTVLTVAAQAWG